MCISMIFLCLFCMEIGQPSSIELRQFLSLFFLFSLLRNLHGCISPFSSDNSSLRRSVNFLHNLYLLQFLASQLLIIRVIGLICIYTFLFFVLFQEKIYQWILRQQEEGSRVSTVDVVAYLQVTQLLCI